MATGLGREVHIYICTPDQGRKPAITGIPRVSSPPPPFYCSSRAFQCSQNDHLAFLSFRYADMLAVVENRVVRSKVQDLFIPEVDVGAFLREACGVFRNRAAFVSTLWKCHFATTPILAAFSSLALI